ncbi:MAG TPA: ABC transporter permease [Candidatus Acidoferrales bacterium]|nr:ABC transporter permease [Candidatus Acidoferrales bacterium]
MNSLWTDVRHALRMLAKNPGFAAVAVITLALGIGANTAIFSVIDAVLLRPLPYPQPNQIVRVWEQAPDGHRMHVSDLNFEDFRNQNHTLAGLAEYTDGPESISGGSEPVRVDVAEVSRDFFDVLGVQPFIGRSFVSSELRLHGVPAVVVSYGYWSQYMGASSDLSRFHLSMNGMQYAVVGVMPSAFDFPPQAAAWVPREMDEMIPSRTAHNWSLVGRVRDGFAIAQARGDLDAIARRIRRQYGKQVDLTGAAVVSLADAMVGHVRGALVMLFAAVGLLLLVACANVAGLLLARTAARSREFALRAALGAGRSRLVRQFLAESTVLAAVGAALGMIIAVWIVKLLPAILPVGFPRSEGIQVNGPILLFTLGAAIAVALALGLIGAWRAGQANLHDALSAGSRGTEGGASHRVRGVLVIAEIAATLVVLTGAGLLGRSFLRLVSINPGFRQEHLMLVQFSPPVQQESTDVLPQGLRPSQVRQVEFVDGVLSRFRRIPGIESLGFTGGVPGTTGCADGEFLILHGQKPPATFNDWDRIAQSPDNVGQADYCVASAGYFETMGIPLLRGRAFDERDGMDAPNVAVITETLARSRWPHQDPIGQVIEFGNMDGNLNPLTVVGVVGDVRVEGLDHPPTPIIYVNYEQRGLNGQYSWTVLLRSTAPPGTIASAARGIFHDVDPNVPVQFSTFADALGGWLAERRFLLLLVAVFATTALTLAAVGLYGIVAYSVTRRTQEIGIREALGAQPRDVLRLVVGEGARLAGAGILIGLALSLGLARLMSSLLFGITPADPLTFIGVSAMLAAVALLASYVPARRAMRVDPMIALRYE